jgi:hypothetical protein
VPLSVSGTSAAAQRQHPVPELPGQLVAESAAAERRDRQSAAGDHQRLRRHRTAVGRQREALAALDAIDPAIGLDTHVRCGALVEQHPHDQLGRLVAEQLAELLLVVGDAMALDQRDEVGGRVARQRRLAEVRVRRQEVLRADVQVGEVAAPAAGHEDLLAHAVGALEHQHAAAAPAGFDGAHQAGGAGPDDDDVEVVQGFRCLCRKLAWSATARSNSGGT